MNAREKEKTEREQAVFEEFASVANLDLELSSVRNESPLDLPDISCNITGSRHYFELAEITDQDLARNLSITLKTMRSMGGALSHTEPLLHVFQSKASKRYDGVDGPLELLVYYDKQVAPYFDLAFIPANVGLIANTMLTSGAWNRVWVFDRSEKRILWKYEAE